MKVKGERDQGCGPTNPCWCGKETWHAMKTEVGVNCWMISLKYLSLCVSHSHIWRWWARALRSGPSASSADGAVGSSCCLSSVIGKEHTFCTSWSGDVLLGNFMDSHHSHSSSLVDLRVLGRSVGDVGGWAPHQRDRLNPSPELAFLGEFIAFLLSSLLKCKPTLFPGPQGQHGGGTLS